MPHDSAILCKHVCRMIDGAPMHERESGAARVGLVLIVAMAMLWATPSDAQSLHVEGGPNVLDGEPIRVHAAGLKPGEAVTISAQRWFAPLSTSKPSLHRFMSSIRIRADEKGSIDLDVMAPDDGSYAGVDPRGLFWSMAAQDLSVTAPANADASTIELRLTRTNAESLVATVRLVPSLAEVVVTPVETFPGAVFAILPGQERPALIVLGGSEGGALIAEAAAPFASHGFAVLALPYYSPANADGTRELAALPAGMIDHPIESLDLAREWLAQQEGVDASRIAIHGTSLGASFALLAAVHLDWVDAVVANVPADVVYDGWGPGVAAGTRSSFALRGKPLPFVPLLGYEQEIARAAQGLDVRVRRPHERGRAARPDLAAKARIPVERIRGAVMLIGAYDDQMWPSGMAVQNLAERRIEAGLPVTALIFPDAGHPLYDAGFSPTTTFNRKHRKVGGTPQTNARAQHETWTGTLAFLRRELGVRWP